MIRERNFGRTWSAARLANMPPPEQRFMAKIEYDTIGGCWLFSGSQLYDTGYGKFSLDGRIQCAHRVSWLLFRGPIPDGHLICHRCDVRACVNPDHLFVGTPSDNIQDMVRKGRGNNPHGDVHALAKLRSTDIPDIRARLAAGQRMSAIAEVYGVTNGTINAIRTGRTWTHVPAFGAAHGVEFNEPKGEAA